VSGGTATGRDARRTLLKETAEIVGQRWFATWRADLLKEGRHIEGGWPGTMPEARALVAAPLASAFTQRRLIAVSNEELVFAARAAYDEARRAWLTSPERWQGSEVVGG
jgi:hypothetical protein